MNYLPKRIVRQWYKKWSAQVAAIATVVATAEWLVPSVSQYLPEHWAKAILPIIFILRIIQQANDDKRN